MDTLVGQVGELFQWVGRIATTVNLLVANAMSKQEGEALGQRLEASIDAKVDAMRQQFEARLDAKVDAKADAMRQQFEARLDAKVDAKVDAMRQQFEASLDAKLATMRQQFEASLDAKLATMRQQFEASLDAKVDAKIATMRRQFQGSVDRTAQFDSLSLVDQTLDITASIERNVDRLKGPNQQPPDPARVRWFLGEEFLQSLRCQGPKDQWVSANDAKRVAKILSDACAVAGQKKNMGGNWNGHVQYICLCAQVQFTKKPKQGGGKFFSYATNQMEEA